MNKYRGVCVGAGYFSHFQYEAWNRMPEVEITAFCNRDVERAKAIAGDYGIPNHYTDWRKMLEREKPDFVDIITPPPTHLEMCRVAADMGIDIICQKPLAPTLPEGREIVEITRNVRFMVHENFRFQPWHRQIRKQIDAGAIGKPFSINMRSRMGDGWGENAYIPRQPYFRDYPQLLIYETGVHFIDTFRYLVGDVTRTHAWLRKLNPVIAGEDCGIMILEHRNGCISQWDANRYNEPPHGVNARYTFGEMLVEGSGGSLRLALDGSITLQRLGEKPVGIDYEHQQVNFAGDCVYFCQRHFIDRLIDGEPFETDGDEYLKTLEVQDAVYASAESGQTIGIE